ncbi:unnamed protein product [Dicrocoelium dendriticum]|nr:unnamed protein product [Dicrocoelium dendriticum]
MVMPEHYSPAAGGNNSEDSLEYHEDQPSTFGPKITAIPYLLNYVIHNGQLSVGALRKPAPPAKYHLNDDCDRWECNTRFCLCRCSEEDKTITRLGHLGTDAYLLVDSAAIVADSVDENTCALLRILLELSSQQQGTIRQFHQQKQ